MNGRDIDTDTFLVSMSSYYGRIAVSDHHVTIHPEILPDAYAAEKAKGRSNTMARSLQTVHAKAKSHDWPFTVGDQRPKFPTRYTIPPTGKDPSACSSGTT